MALALNLIEGTVQEFFADRGSGLIALANGGRLVFHISGFEFLRGLAGQVKWVPLPQGVTYRDPQPDEVLVFELGTDHQGLPCVGRWTRRGVLTMAEIHAAAPVVPAPVVAPPEPVAAPVVPAPTVFGLPLIFTAPPRPVPSPAVILAIEPIYRLMTSTDGGKPKEEWRGASSDDPTLSKFWIPGQRMTFSHDDGWSVSKQFQKSTDGGTTWINVDPPQHAPDPRRRR